MKKILLLFCLICFCLPALALNDEGEEISLDFLNQSVHSKTHQIMQTLYVDDSNLDKIKTAYKSNPNSIKLKGVNDFCVACIQRNQNLLNSYHNDYFLPAYNEYKKYDKSITLQQWIDSIGLSERSAFYDFYTFTESNLEACQKYYNLSK